MITQGLLLSIIALILLSGCVVPDQVVSVSNVEDQTGVTEVTDSEDNVEDQTGVTEVTDSEDNVEDQTEVTDSEDNVEDQTEVTDSENDSFPTFSYELEIDGSTIIIPYASFTEESGWFVLYTVDNGAPGKIIGYAKLDMGTNYDIQVKVDTTSLTPTVHAKIHVDNGVEGTFEFPGVDTVLRMYDMAESAAYIF